MLITIERVQGGGGGGMEWNGRGRAEKQKGKELQKEKQSNSTSQKESINDLRGLQWGGDHEGTRFLYHFRPAAGLRWGTEQSPANPENQSVHCTTFAAMNSGKSVG